MAYRIDTTILARLANATDAQHAVAARAVLELHRGGEVLNVTPQVLVEFRNVATRPVAVNGLGLSTVEAETQAATFEARFPLLAETPDIYPAGLHWIPDWNRCCRTPWRVPGPVTVPRDSNPASPTAFSGRWPTAHDARRRPASRRYCWLRRRSGPGWRA